MLKDLIAWLKPVRSERDLTLSKGLQGVWCFFAQQAFPAFGSKSSKRVNFKHLFQVQRMTLENALFSTRQTPQEHTQMFSTPVFYFMTEKKKNLHGLINWINETD